VLTSSHRHVKRTSVVSVLSSFESWWLPRQHGSTIAFESFSALGIASDESSPERQLGPRSSRTEGNDPTVKHT
jgi:hypothetical protein